MNFDCLTTVTMWRFVTKGRRRALESLDKHWAGRPIWLLLAVLTTT